MRSLISTTAKKNRGGQRRVQRREQASVSATRRNTRCINSLSSSPPFFPSFLPMSTSRKPTSSLRLFFQPKRYQSSSPFSSFSSKPSSGKKKDFELPEVNFDWSTMEGELPDLPPEDEPLTKKDRWWEQFIKDKSRSLDENLIAMPEEKVPHVRIRALPLNYSGNRGMAEIAQKMKTQQLAEQLKGFLFAYKFDEMVDCFMEMRKLNLVPPPESYDLIIPVIATWGDFEAVEMLIKEMDIIGYEKGEKVWYARLSGALVKNENIEKVWQEILDNKIEINAHMHALRLFAICRFDNDLEAAMKFFGEMKKNGKVLLTDPTPYNLILDLCEVNGHIDVAEKLFAEMESEGYLEIVEPRDVIEVNTGGQMRDTVIPKVQVLEATYALMVEICTQKHDPVGVAKYSEMAREVHYRFHKKVRDRFRLPKRSYFKVVKMYVRMKDNRTAISMLKEMSGFERYTPERAMWREVLMMLTEQDPPPTKEFLEIKEHYEMWGFDYDPEFNSYILRMWARAKDFRRVKNAYDALISAGLLPNEEARTTMMEVYVAAGQLDEVQRYYETEVRSGRKINKRMHQMMLHDYLKRGFPGSATEILQRMIDDNIKADQEAVEAIALGYAKVGAGNRVLDIIDKLMTGTKALYSLSNVTLSAAVLGLSKHMSEGEKARQVWSKYSGQVQLDYNAAQKIIEGFANLKDSHFASLAYTKLVEEWKFRASDGPDLFATFLQLPPNTPIFPDTFSVLKLMRDSGIEPTTQCYEGAMKGKAMVGDVKGALMIVRKYIEHTLERVDNISVSGFGGIPLHRDTILTFFTIMARFEVGRYGREARAWLKRLQPMAGTTMPFFRRLDKELEKNKDKLEGTHFSTMQSFEISRYIHRLDDTQFAVLNEPGKVGTTGPYEEIFTGSDADIEDILIHQYGFEPKAVYQAMGTDPEYLKLKAELEKLNTKYPETIKQ